MKKSEIIKVSATLNFILFFVGFDLVTSCFSIFIPNISATSQYYTIPYRAISLGLSLLVILITLNIKKHKSSFLIIVLSVFISMITLRFFYDFYYRNDIYIEINRKRQFLLLFIQMLITILSFIRSYRFISLADAFKWIFLSFNLIIIINYFTVQEFSFNARNIEFQVQGGVRNTIGTGYLAASYLVLFIYFITWKFNTVLKLLTIPIAIFAVIILLKTGSRGPLLALIITLTIYLAFRFRKIYLISIIGIILVFCFQYFFLEIVALISKISPVMSSRIMYTVELGDNSRTVLFAEGFKLFLENPIYGNSAFLYRPDGVFTYPHQLIIEALMSTGIIGGVLLICIIGSSFLIAIRNINSQIKNNWLELIVIIFIVRGFTAGTIFGTEYLPIFTFMLLSRTKLFLKNENCLINGTNKNLSSNNCPQY